MSNADAPWGEQQRGRGPVLRNGPRGRNGQGSPPRQGWHVAPVSQGRLLRAGPCCRAAPPARGSPGRGRRDPSGGAGAGGAPGGGAEPCPAPSGRNPIKGPDPASSSLPSVPPRPARRSSRPRCPLLAAPAPLRSRQGAGAPRPRPAAPAPRPLGRGDSAHMELPGGCHGRCLAAVLLLASCIGCAATPRRNIPRRQGRTGGGGRRGVPAPRLPRTGGVPSGAGAAPARHRRPRGPGGQRAAPQVGPVRELVRELREPGGASAAPRPSLRAPAALARGREDAQAMAGIREVAGSVCVPSGRCVTRRVGVWPVSSDILHPVPVGALYLQTRTRLQLLRKELAEILSGFPWMPLPVELEARWSSKQSGGDPSGRLFHWDAAVTLLCVSANNLRHRVVHVKAKWLGKQWFCPKDVAVVYQAWRGWCASWSCSWLSAARVLREFPRLSREGLCADQGGPAQPLEAES